MDNLSHSLVGALLAKCGLEKTTPRATAALIIASNLPDIDSVAGFAGQLHYLEHHRGITHSIVGIALQAIALGAVLSIGSGTGARRPKASALMALSALAMLLHLGMDYMNSYGIRPWLPWDATWLYGDYAFILDPWIWLIPSITLFAGRTGPVALWGALAVVGTSLLAWASLGSAATVPTYVLPLWACGMALSVWLRHRTSFSAPTLARAGATLLAGYVVFLNLAHRHALDGLRQRAPSIAAPQAVVRMAVTPTPANPFRWSYLIETDDRILYRTTSSWTSSQAAWSPPWNELPRNLDNPRVQPVLSSCEGRSIARFFRFPAAELFSNAREQFVLFRDARYAVRGITGFGTVRVPLTTDGAPVPQPCPESAAWLGN